MELQKFSVVVGVLSLQGNLERDEIKEVDRKGMKVF